MDRFDELRDKIVELDGLIDSVLDSEPEDQAGQYGKTIRDLFTDCKWLDVFIGEFE